MAAFNLASKMEAKLSFQSFLSSLVRFHNADQRYWLTEYNHRLLLYQMSIFAKYLLQIFDCLRELTKDFRHVLSKRNPRHTT